MQFKTIVKIRQTCVEEVEIIEESAALVRLFTELSRSAKHNESIPNDIQSEATPSRKFFCDIQLCPAGFICHASQMVDEWERNSTSQ